MIDIVTPKYIRIVNFIYSNLGRDDFASINTVTLQRPTGGFLVAVEEIGHYENKSSVSVHEVAGKIRAVSKLLDGFDAFVSGAITPSGVIFYVSRRIDKLSEAIELSKYNGIVPVYDVQNEDFI